MIRLDLAIPFPPLLCFEQFEEEISIAVFTFPYPRPILGTKKGPEPLKDARTHHQGIWPADRARPRLKK